MTLLVCVLLLACQYAFALNPALDISQYAHTSWKFREGFSKGVIYSIAQTPDGYLWLGTEFGLVRFDGVKNVPWQPPREQHLPDNYVWSLLAARDGTLWIGTLKGLASWKDGKLTQYPELAGQPVVRLLEDREGMVWAGAIGFPTGRLCAIQNGVVHCQGEDGSLGHGVFGLYEDRKGNLWLGVEDGLWRWKPGPSKFYSIPHNPDSIRAFAEDDDGALLISTSSGLRRFVDGKIEVYPLPGARRQLSTESILRDRDGGLWMGSYDRGLVHVYQGRTDVFVQADGLSGDHVIRLFEDREGSIWVATNKGLDRFRDFAVTTFTVSQGLSHDNVWSVLAGSDGSVWLSTSDGLDRWNSGQITIPRTGSTKQDGKLNGDAPHSLFQDRRGRIWVSTLHQFGYLKNQRFLPVSGLPGGVVHAIAEDKAGNLWIANQDLGLFSLAQGNVVEQLPWAKLGHKDHARALAVDPLKGGLWLGFPEGGMSYFKDGQVRAAYTATDGLGQGWVNDFLLDRGGLWAATDGGLSRLNNGHIVTLMSKNGLPAMRSTG